MNAVARRLYTSPYFSKIIEWTKLISITGSSQLLIQGVGLVSGIFVIRLLSTQEYGLYTLGNTMLGTMLVLGDSGISTSVMAQGGKVWQNREKLGSVLVSGFNLRKKFAMVSLLIAIPILLYLLIHHNAGWLTSTLIIGSLIPAFLTGLSSNLLIVGPSLHQAIAPLQKNQIGVSIGRLIMVMITLFIFPWAYIAILSATLPQVWGNIRLRKISSGYADYNQKPDTKIQKEILSFVKRILPGSIYYCLSGQITIWLISIFGNTSTIAQIGALGRLSTMLNLFGSIFCTLLIPRFARLPNNKKLLLKRFMQMQLGITVSFLLIIFIVSLFPSQLLWIIGKNYFGLEKELVLSVGCSCMSLMAGLSFTISTSRNWAINPIVSIPITLLAIICFASLLDISSLKGILLFNLFVSITEVIIYFMYCVLKISKVNEEPGGGNQIPAFE